MDRQLAPQLHLRNRLIALGILLIPVLLSYRIGIVWQILSCFMPIMLTGTYRVTKLKGDRFDTWFYLGFIGVNHVKCNLAAVVTIHTTYKAAQTGMWTFFLFGPMQWILGMVFDRLLPVLGGPYEIWLETSKGREILAWAGFSQEFFEQNVALLKMRTGADVHLR